MANQMDSENVGSIDMEVDAIISYSERVDSLIRSETASFYGDSPLYTFASLVDTAIRSSFASYEADYEPHSPTTTNVHSQELSLQQSHNNPYYQTLTQQTHFHHLPHHSNEDSSGVIRAQRMRWTAALHSRFVQLLSGHPSKGLNSRDGSKEENASNGLSRKASYSSIVTIRPNENETWSLKVSIDCEGCAKKVFKVLQKIDGIFTVAIDMPKQKVTVTGSVGVKTLIRKLVKVRIHAEIWQEDVAAMKGKSSGEEKK